jgi:hypothetical protein
MPPSWSVDHGSASCSSRFSTLSTTYADGWVPFESRSPSTAAPRRPASFKPAIDAILRADLDGPRKQRHCVYAARPADEYALTGVSYRVLRAYVAARRPEIHIEAVGEIVALAAVTGTPATGSATRRSRCSGWPIWTTPPSSS